MHLLLPKKSQDVHVSIDDDPLPSPLTTRNLGPRLVRPTYRDTFNYSRQASGSSFRTASQQNSRQASVASSLTTRHPPNFMMQSDQPEAGPSASSSARTETTNDRISAGPSRRSKRRRTGQSHGTQRDWYSGSEEEDVDQLEPEDISFTVTSHSMAEGSSIRYAETEILGEASGSASSSSAFLSSRANAPVSSPSLAKILHPNNIEFQNISVSSSPIRVTPSKPIGRAPEPEVEPLAEYTCPICFFPPTNATLTQCGHICCGACLFTAVKSTMQRGALMRTEANVARCPVCRAEISGWDGRGGGVIGLKPRAVISL